MTTPTYFTVVADYKSVVVDSTSDVDADPQLGPVTAKVTFTPVLRNGDVILATDASPRPTGFVAAPIVARIDTDGRLKLRVEPDGDRDDFANVAAFPATGSTAKVYFSIATQTFYRWNGSGYVETYPYAAVRLLADTPLLELDSELYYRVTFSEVVFNGGPGYIAPFTFQAPNTDTELNLIEVMRQPGQPASGILKIAPGAVRTVDGNKLQFSFAGVDIPDPVEVDIDASAIGDSGATGRLVIQSESAADARSAIGFRDGVEEFRTHIDLRDWEDVRNANWKTFLGIEYTEGSTTVGNTPWTAADVGKIAMILVDSDAKLWFKTEIVSVGSNGAATIADPAPDGTGLRCRYGFDGTEAINDALAEINARTDSPVEVYLGGNYRLTQLVIPCNIVLRGVPWKNTTALQQASLSRTVLAQLAGSECDFVVFGDHPETPGALASSGLIDIDLWGPEKNVVDMPEATTGHGVSFSIDTLGHGTVIDGFQLRNVAAYNFPESGFRCFGAVPFYVENCRALWNGRYGFEHRRHGGNSTNALHFTNFSADWNNLGAIGFHSLQPNDTVFITGVKSEGTAAGDEADVPFRSGPNYQSNCLVFENCDDSPVLINGVSHIRIVRAEIAPGPTIVIRDTNNLNRRPRLSFNSVLTRIYGGEVGSIADAVTIRDEVAGLDVPRETISGHYPTTTLTPMVDIFGNTVNYERLTALKTDFSEKADGSQIAFGDDGSPITIDGVTPEILDGLLQAELTGLSGSQVSYLTQPLQDANSIGASFKLAGADAGIGLTFWESPIGRSPFRVPNAGAFLLITPSTWFFQVYEDGDESTSATIRTVSSGSFSPALAADWDAETPGSGTLHNVDMLISGSKATIKMPNGATITATDPQIAAIPRNYPSHFIFRPTTTVGAAALDSIRAGAPKTMTGTTLANGTLLTPIIDRVHDANDKESVRFIASTDATASLNIYNAPTGTPPIIEAKDPTQDNVSLALAVKGTGGVQIGTGTTSTGRITPSGSNKSLNLQSTGSGTVQINGVQAVDVSSPQNLDQKTLLSPTLVTPVLGTPSSGTLTSCTGLPLTGLVSDTSTALGVGSLNIGHASDTTVSRSAAGKLAVEGDELAFATDGLNTEWVTTGQETMFRRFIQTAGMPSTNGNLRLTYFTARKSETVTQVRVPTGSTAAVGATLCRIGLYTVDPSTGDLTLVTSTANDTNLWIAQNTAYTKTLSSSYAVTRGTRYAIGLLVVGASTAPTFMGSGPGGAATQFAAEPRLAALRGSRTDLDASITVANLTDSTNQYYAVLLP